MIAFIVALEGITQVISYQPLKTNSREEIKLQGFKILKKLGLTQSVPAAGVMFAKNQNGIISIDPVVWVRDIQTLFYETACASGATAVGLVEALNSDKQSPSQLRKPSLSETSAPTVIPGSTRNLSTFPFSVRQPAGTSLKLFIKLKNGIPDYAEIGGPVKIVKKLKVSLSPSSSMEIKTINCR